MKPESATGGFEVPVTDRYFEDYTAGFTQEYGSLTVTDEEVIDLAAQFDPQHSA
ncbi:hypothetical protein [Streptomyces sp. HUAS TT7]|uniref:hypothetical protein n=1 Tax=Streptomyces sp. HUAS TT7 TaxID=3447507 RepID=UPI003F65EED8